MSARFNADSGRYEHVGASSERLHEDYDTVRCDSCGSKVPEPNAVEVGRLRFCDDDCVEAYAADALASQADAAYDESRES